MIRGPFWLGFALAFALVPGLSSAAPTGATAVHVAYLDPGAGSYILQALVAMLAGAAVAIHLYWTKIKKFLGISGADANDEKRADRRGDD
jgi:hypothetical protein